MHEDTLLGAMFILVAAENTSGGRGREEYTESGGDHQFAALSTHKRPFN